MMASDTRRLAEYRLLVGAGQVRLMPCPGFVWLESLKTRQATITISQHDVRELQLVKDAIRTGIHVPLESNG